jgi:obg-like ATPase 1
LQIVDIAGLVPGASKGEGLGNAFLSHIKEVDGIYHVLRTFDDPSVTHTEIEVDPVRDANIVSTELALKDLEYVKNRIEDCDKKIKRNNDKEATEEKALLSRVQTMLEANKWVRFGEWKADEIALLNTHRLLTAKPVVYLINLSEADFQAKKNKFLVHIKNWVTNNIPGDIIPYSADYEKRIQHEPHSETDAGPKSMLTKIIRTGYSTLDLINFFTCGEDEVRAWTIRKRTKAPQAAGVIHTDFEKGFICAEVMKYTDLMELGSEHACKHEGKYKQHGKDYVVEDGDIIFYKFNVGKGK